MAFEILLPIGYLLIMSSVLLRLGTRLTLLLSLLGMTIGVSLFWAEGKHTYPALLTVGLSGILAGLVGTFPWDRRKRFFLVSGLTFVVGLVLAPYLLRFLLGYILYILIVSKFVTEVSQMLDSNSLIRTSLVLLGRYSLFAYLAQILILQAVYRLLVKQRWDLGWEVFVICLGICVILIMACSLAEYLRKKHRHVDSVYRFVFA